MKKLLKKYGFTLVELIVVIVILAVLAALAFMMVNKWIGASKDTNRISTIATLRRGIDANYIEKGSYPFPDADNEEGKVITGTVNGKIVLYKGTIGDNVIKNLGNIFKKTPLDPIGKRYAYGITASGREYEIGTVLENETKLGILNEAYAANYKARLEGTYGGMILFATGGKQYLANIPSLVFTVSGSVTTNMNMLSNNIYYAINSGNNLPYTVTTKSDAQKDNINAVIKSKTKSTTATVQLVEIPTATDLSTIFNGDVLASFGGNLGTIQNEIKKQSGQTTITSSPGTIQSCTCSQSNATSCEQIFDGNTWGTCSVKTCNSGYTVSGNSCEESACGGTPSGSTNNFYDVSSVPYVDNNCPAHMKTFTCDKGEWKDGINPADTATYQYLACSRGTPTNCSTTTYNGYTIPDTTHALSGSATKDVTENNGTFRYTQNFECNNGTFNYTLETGPVLQSCNENYHTEDNNTCTSNTKSVTCNGTVPSGVAYTLGASSINITWNGTVRPAASSWTYGGTSACQYTCASIAVWSGSSCVYNVFPGLDGISGTADDCNTANITLNNGQIWSACNLGAKMSYTPSTPNSGTFNSDGSTIRGGDDNVNGKIFQWGRNKGFFSSENVNQAGPISTYTPLNDTYQFILGGSYVGSNGDWLLTTDATLWGGASNDSSILDGQTNDTLRKGPCPVGWHVPSAKDWQDACNSILGITCSNGITDNGQVRIKLLLPYTGGRWRNYGTYYYQGKTGYYRSSSLSFLMSFSSSAVSPTTQGFRATGHSVRCLKN